MLQRIFRLATDKRTAYLLFSALVLLILPAISSAATDGQRRDCEHLSATAIFIGQVLETTPTQIFVGGVADEPSPRYAQRIEVDELLKGDVGREITVNNGVPGCAECLQEIPQGKRFLIYASRDSDGRWWAGLPESVELNGDELSQKSLATLRRQITKGKGSLYGKVTYTAPPVWNDQGQPVGGGWRAVPDLVIRAASGSNTFTTRTAKDGTYEFKDLPNGRYTVTPDVEQDWTFDQNFFADRYQKSIGDGSCANVTFDMYPTTRLKGRMKLSSGQQFGTPLDGDLSLQDIVAVPTGLQTTNERSGIGATVHPDGRFDIWPIPAGDYYVGINITKSPTPEMSYETTYYPGVTDKKSAKVVHLEPGEVKEIELPVPKFAQERLVHIVAIGMDGKPLRKVRVQREDLRFHGDATNSTVDVDLDANGAGKMTVYAGITYHLHASYFVRSRNTECSAPVLVPAGSETVQARFVMNHDTTADDRNLMGDYDSCYIVAVDKASKDVAIAQPIR